MTPCGACWHWTALLALPSSRESRVRFEHWLLYHWHVVVHQRVVS